MGGCWEEKGTREEKSNGRISAFAGGGNCVIAKKNKKRK